MALIDAGLQILGEQGLAGLSLRNCALRAGASHTAPKNHFGNMSGLLTAIAARGYKRMAEQMQDGLNADASRAERRSCAFSGYVNFAAANPALFELMFSKRKINSADPVMQEPVGACFEILKDISKNLKWDRAGEPDDEVRAQMLLWSLLHGFAQLTVSGTFKTGQMMSLNVLDVMPKFED